MEYGIADNICSFGSSLLSNLGGIQCEVGVEFVVCSVQLVKSQSS